MRLLLCLSLLAASCAFPPGAGPDEDRCELLICAGDCVDNECVPAGLGEACSLFGQGPACQSGASCVGGVCRLDGCEGDTCNCPGAPRCAGRCAEGQCFPAGPGESCDLQGSGVACSIGSCVNGRCVVDAEPVPLEGWRDAFGSGYCAFLQRCGAWPSSLSAECEQAFAGEEPLFGSIAADVQAAEDGLLEYDPVEAGDCLATLTARDCLGPLPAACARVFTSGNVEGASCWSDEGCASGLFCARTDPAGLSCGGVCEPRAGEGEGCGSRPCDEGLRCVSELGEDVCRPRGAPGGVGAGCVPGEGSCAAGLYCDATGRCVRRGKEGEQCDDWSGCGDGLTCAIVGTSQALCLPMRGVGQSCLSDQQCSPGHALVADAVCVNGRCERLPAFGSCAESEFLPNRCDPRVSFCDFENRCVPFRPLDGNCSSSGQCGFFNDAICSFGACRMPESCG